MSNPMSYNRVISFGQELATTIKQNIELHMADFIATKPRVIRLSQWFDEFDNTNHLVINSATNGSRLDHIWSNWWFANGDERWIQICLGPITSIYPPQIPSNAPQSAYTITIGGKLYLYSGMYEAYVVRYVNLPEYTIRMSSNMTGKVILSPLIDIKALDANVIPPQGSQISHWHNFHAIIAGTGWTSGQPVQKLIVSFAGGTTYIYPDIPLRGRT